VLVVEQRRVPVVVTFPVLVEELELVFDVEEVVDEAVVAVVEVVESEVVESEVVDAAALEGAEVLEAAAEDSVVSAVVDFAVAFDVVFSVVFSEVVSVAESELDESALLLNSCLSSSSRSSVRYSCANHTAPTVASAFEHPPAI